MSFFLDTLQTPTKSRYRTLGILASVLFLASVGKGVAVAAPKPLDTVQLKQTLTKRGIGKAVRITEADGTHVTGIITTIADDSFELTIKNTNKPVQVPYAQVTGVKNDGMSTAGKVGIGVGVVAAVYVVAAVVVLIIAFSLSR